MVTNVTKISRMIKNKSFIIITRKYSNLENFACLLGNV